MKGEVERDDLFNIGCAAYNFFPNGQKPESSFFLMFGRDMYIHYYNKPITTQLKYSGDTIDTDDKRGIYIDSNKSQKNKR